MIITRAFCFVFVLTVAGIAIAPRPDFIEQSNYGIKYLWDEAVNGRLRYDLCRDFPPFQRTWPTFLEQHGGSIVKDHL